MADRNIITQVIEILKNDTSDVFATDVTKTVLFTNLSQTSNKVKGSIENKRSYRKALLDEYTSALVNDPTLGDPLKIGLFSRVLSNVWEIDIRLDYADISQLGSTIVNFIMNVPKFGRDSIVVILNDQFFQLQDLQLEAPDIIKLGNAMKKAFWLAIASVDESIICMIRCSSIIEETNRLFYQYFENLLGLDFPNASSDNTGNDPVKSNSLSASLQEVAGVLKRISL